MTSDGTKTLDSSDAPAGSRSAAKLSADAVHSARVMVDAFRLASQSLDVNQILNGVLDGAAALVEYDAAGVYVIGPSGESVRFQLVRGCEMPMPRLRAPFERQGLLGRVLATGQPVSTTAADSSETTQGRPCARSRLIVPIVGMRHRVLGALDVWSDRPDGYDALAATLLQLYGSAVAGMIETARLYAETIEKRRMEQDLTTAREVIQDLLPNTSPSLPGLDIAGAHETSLLVGGDYYEFIPLADERCGLVIADVVGKGITAALLVSAIRATVYALAGHELALRAIMRRANRFFHESVEAGRFVTLFYGVMDVPTRRLIYVNAGHPPPILLRFNGEVQLLEEGGMPLGLFEAPRFFEGFARLRSGDLLALYTDGIVETMDAQEQAYGRTRLIDTMAAVRDATAQEICDIVMRDVRRFGAGQAQDDRTLVVMKAL